MPSDLHQPSSPPRQCQSRARRLKATLLIPVVIGFGLGCKVYSGPFADFVRDFGPASAAYVVLLMLIMFLITPGEKRIPHIAMAAFLITCGVEGTQLWSAEWLQALRETLIGRLVLGTTFNLLDFPAYVAGTVIGTWILKLISGDNTPARTT